MDQIIPTFRQAGKEEQLFQWLSQQISSNLKESTQAIFYWFLGDYQASAQTLAPILICENRHHGEDDYKTWRVRFKDLNKPELVLFLSTLAEACSQVPIMLLELLNHLLDEAEPDSAQFIKVSETLIELNTPDVFDYYGGLQNETQIESYYELALRLMRFYQKTQQLEKLRALGLRIASKQEPFTTPKFKDEVFLTAFTTCRC